MLKTAVVWNLKMRDPILKIYIIFPLIDVGHQKCGRTAINHLPFIELLWFIHKKKKCACAKIPPGVSSAGPASQHSWWPKTTGVSRNRHTRHTLQLGPQL